MVENKEGERFALPFNLFRMWHRTYCTASVNTTSLRS